MHGILAASVVSFLTGFVLVNLAWPRRRSPLCDLPLKVPLALGLGFGVSSCLYFLGVEFLGGSAFGCTALDLLFLLALSLLLAVRRLRWPRPAPADRCTDQAPVPPVPDSGTSRVLRWALILSAAIAGLVFALLAAGNPHGDWDAWAIWNKTARVLYRSHENFGGTYHLLVRWTHPAVAVDYPLLVPAQVARFWTYAGGENLAAPALVGFVYCLSIVWLLVSSLAYLRSRENGFLGGVLLLGTPFFLGLGSSQLADTPLSFYFLATLVLIALHASDEERTPTSVLPLMVGWMIGLACWTKNEGMLFLVSVSVPATYFAIRAKRAPHVRQGLLCLGGLLIPLACVLVWKMDFGFANRMISNSLQPSRLAHLLDASRHLLICREFARQSLAFGQWPVSVSALLPLYVLLAGVEPGAGRRIGLAALAVVAVQFAGYFTVYLLTPYELDWHLRTSLNRLLMQWWPSLIFGLLLLSRRPGMPEVPVCVPGQSYGAGLSTGKDDGKDSDPK